MDNNGQQKLNVVGWSTVRPLTLARHSYQLLTVCITSVCLCVSVAKHSQCT